MKTSSQVYKFLSFFILLTALSFSISCASKKKVINDDFAVDSAEAGLTNADLEIDGNPDQSVNIADGTDEFGDFDETQKAVAQNEPPAPVDETASLENELNSISDAPTPPPVVDVTPPVETPPIVETVVPEPQIVEAPITPVQPPAEVAVSNPAVISKITNIQYKGNSSGGTVIINSNAPLAYTTRVNSSTNQVVVEVQNAVVPGYLKRPLNTKDMSSSIGNVDVYQKKDSNVARFVIQLRPNSPEPLVQPEGNSLLIVGSPMDGSGPNPSQSSTVADNGPVSSPQNNSELNHEMEKGIMNSDDLEEFLTNNNKFYGKPISIETTKMDVRDILKFISEESGVNMIFDDDVSGDSALKLRKVPWDQALVILLKSKKLGYRRQGTILRIAKVDNLIKEDEAAIKLKESKSVVEPLIVRNFSINYADIDKLEAKIKDYINDTKKDAVNRGRVTSDTRTNMLIVTETETKLKQVEQLLKALDTQPQQVMIEARIIEASDDYQKTIGGSLGLNRNGVTGTPIGALTPGRGVTGSGAQGDQYFSPALNVSPAKGLGQAGSFVGNIFFGTLGSFGNLDAQLALDEIEDRVRILSSPRIAVLTNTTATINQGATILQKTTAQAPTGGGNPVVTFVPIKIGVTLKVTPQISNIGTVRLKLDVSRTAANGSEGATTDRSANTEIIVKSGDTAVIGGVFQSDIINTKSGVPGLKDIPILGTLFKGQSDTNTKTELMIFVTPKVIPLLNQVFKAEGDAGSSTQ
ncbi:MAG: type IV pilus secretin PilQ [Moraxellaceae bacterium]|nr:type IV pilus secretin PilQ [Pseudobdellovibrionaceae bacterium]